MSKSIGRIMPSGPIPPRPLSKLSKNEHDAISIECGSGVYTQYVEAGNHVFYADEPLDHGGDDLGPNPFDLLLASLASCTSITLRMYAKRKGMKLERVGVRTAYRKYHAEVCEECTQTEGYVDVIERDIELIGDLSDEDRKSLMKIADKCPVHQIMHSDAHVRTRLL